MKFFLGLLLFLVILSQVAIVLLDIQLATPRRTPIKVGLVYSQTGFKAFKDNVNQEATLLAIDEINRQGGLLGRKIVPIIKDSQSNWAATKAAVKDLILNEKVAVIFGCWTPGSRYTINKLFEEHHHLLLTPYQYEGIVHSPHIVHLGTTANQQASPTAYYCLKNFGKRFFLVGSDYAYPHVTNAMIKDIVIAQKGEILDEMYLPIKGEDVDPIIQAILESRPDVIINTMIGPDSQLFLKKLRAAGITSDHIPIFCLSLTEVGLENMNIEEVIGHYATLNYFQSIDSKANQDFVKRFREFSHLENVDNTAEAAYISVHMWAKAVQETGTTDVNSLLYTLSNMSINAPEGLVTMDTEGTQAWKYSRIGRIRPDKQFDIVWESPFPIRPIAYPLYRSEYEWNEMTESLYRKFGYEK